MNDCNDSQLEMLWSPYSLCFVMPYINRRLSLFPPSFPTRVLLAHPAPATMASFLFLIAKHLLILGPSYLLFPLSGLFFLQISARFAPSLHFNSSQRVFSDLFYLFIYNYFFIGGMIFIGVELIYNVVLVSAVQQSESAIHIHITILLDSISI